MIYYSNLNGKLYNGHVLDILKSIPDESVYTCITSPPYWGLRDYNTDPVIWDGKPSCDHEWKEIKGTKNIGRDDEYCGGKQYSMSATERKHPRNSNFCTKCNAWKGQLGLEPTPELYVKHITDIFREVRRVLKPDGTLWLNIADSYSTTPPGNKENNKSLSQSICEKTNDKRRHTGIPKSIKAKNLIGIPWMTAFSLRDDGWYLRSDIIWHKPNPMPESVKDRPTKSHEYIFLMAKSKMYYYDYEAIKEPAKDWGQRDRTLMRNGTTDPLLKHHGLEDCDFAEKGKNKRSVWTVNTKPFSEAHFAVFPPELIRPCILAGCPKRESVLDPFFGSGTVGYVAEEEDRCWIGIELNKEYCNIAKERLREFEGKITANFFFELDNI